jgi:hypothetical protein
MSGRANTANGIVSGTIDEGKSFLGRRNNLRRTSSFFLFLGKLLSVFTRLGNFFPISIVGCRVPLLGPDQNREYGKQKVNEENPHGVER